MSCMLRPPGNGRHTSKPAPSMAWCAGTVRERGPRHGRRRVGTGDAGEHERVVDGHCGHGGLRGFGWCVPLQPSCARNYSDALTRVTGSGRGPGAPGGRSRRGCRSASSSSGKRRISVPMARRPSRRASAAPRQWWMPEPNARCCAAPARVRSSGSASSPQWSGVAVGGRQAREHEDARLDGLAADVEVGRGDPARELHRRVVAQQLVDRVGVEARVVAPPFELRAVAQQRERAVADEVDGRLVPGDVQQDRPGRAAPRGRAGRRRPRRRAARRAGRRPDARASTRSRPSTCSMIWSDAATISSRCCSASTARAPSVSVCARSRIAASSDAGMPSISEITRNGSGKARSAITSSSAPTGHGAASSISSTMRLHPGREPLDHPGREHLLDEPAEAGVVGRVEVEDAAGAPLRPVAQDLLADLGARVGARSTLRSSTLSDGSRSSADGVVVAEQRPEAERASAAPGWSRRARRTGGTDPPRSPVRTG